jgi:uncharacterized membrane protein (UPF0127 family)
VTSLTRNGEVVADLEVAEAFRARSKGLLGREGIDGALLLRPAMSVHTFRMRFDIDVAFCDRHLVVVDTVTMRRNRLGRPRLRSRTVVEAAAGAFARWGIEPGVQLGVED